MMAEYFNDQGFTMAAIDNLYDRWVPDHRYYPWFRNGYSHYSYPQPASNRFLMVSARLRSLAAIGLTNPSVEFLSNKGRLSLAT